LQGKKVCAFAGIAKPDSFKKTLLALGAHIISWDIFPDHHRYRLQELKNIRNNMSKNSADLIITTEKDGMRLQEFTEFLSEIYLLRIELEIVPDEMSLKNFILGKLERQ
jgi:tetraacyldisaccharide 4'-kinase